MRRTHKRPPLKLALLSGLYFFLSPHESLSQQYKLDLMAATSSGGLQSIDSRVSINDAGTVAFAGFDSDGFSKLFVAQSPGTPQPISFISSNRLFSAASINNQSPARVATVERVSGSSPIWIVRTWKAYGPGADSLPYGSTTRACWMVQQRDANTPTVSTDENWALKRRLSSTHCGGKERISCADGAASTERFASKLREPSLMPSPGTTLHRGRLNAK